MTDNENILLENFFKEAAQQRIEDNGFSDRVMASLPESEVSLVHRQSRLWTLFCIVIALALFMVFGGWEALKGSIMMICATGVTSLEVLVRTIPTADVHLDPVTVLLMLAFVGVYLPYLSYRKLSAAL